VRGGSRRGAVGVGGGDLEVGKETAAARGREGFIRVAWLREGGERIKMRGEAAV